MSLQSSLDLLKRAKQQVELLSRQWLVLQQPLQQIVIKEQDEKQMLTILYNQWRAGIITAKMDLKEFTDDVRALRENKKHLHMTSHPEPPKIQLGDRVKIKMKHRQVKQINKGGWNDLIKKDIGEIGNVVGILAPDGVEVIIYFSKSGKRWTVSSHALEMIHEDDEEVGRQTMPCTSLKIGDDVMIAEGVPEYVITTMQNMVSLSAPAVISHRHSLLKLLAFTGRDIAIVSIDEYKSIMLHVELLSRKPETPGIARAPTDKGGAQKKPFLACHSIGNQYSVKNNIEDLIKCPFWTYHHTKILGKPGTICYHGQQGELGIKVDGEGFLITTAYLGKQLRQKRGSLRKTAGGREPYKLSDRFPFPVGAAVQCRIDGQERCERQLKDLKIPLSFLKVVQEECATFLGYDAQGRAQIELQSPVHNVAVCQKFVLGTPVGYLKRASEVVVDHAHKQMLRRVRSIKVNDSVSLRGAKYSQFTLEELDCISTSEDLKQAMTSNATLVAFDDENDRAVLKYGDGKMFTCSPIFVDVACSNLADAVSERLASSSTSCTGKGVTCDDDNLEPDKSYSSFSSKDDVAETYSDLNDDVLEGEEVEEHAQDNIAMQEQFPLVGVQETYQDTDSNDIDEGDECANSDIPPESSDILPEPRDDPAVSLDDPREPVRDTPEPLDGFPETLDDTSQALDDPVPHASHETSAQPSPTDEDVMETPAMILYNPTTKDFVVRGNLDRHAQPFADPAPPQPGLRRQNSTMPASDDNNSSPIIGDINNNFYNFNCCKVNIDANAGASIDPTN